MGMMKKKWLECCTCGDVRYPCECRDDILAIFWGELVIGTGSPCEKSLTGVTRLTSGPTINKAWNDFDCFLTVLSENLITAFPPDCTETDLNILNKRVVFCKKQTNETNPYRDDSLLRIGDYYAAVYNATDDTFLGVYYGYEVCCINETPENAATSHLAWVKLSNVVMGAATYNMYWYNVTTANEYGNCGLEPPF